MKEPPGPRASTASEQPGFRANLTGASLTDLVQMECLARTTQVVRVVSGDEVGYLYFQAGSIVHAMSSNAVGEPAALEILGWERGSFEPCNAGWPTTSTITGPWQALLMAAMTRRDEMRRAEAQREPRRDEPRRQTVVDFPRDRTNPAMTHKQPPSAGASQPPAAIPTSRSVTPSTPVPASRNSPASGLGLHAIERAVRLEADGKLVSARGEAEELAAMTAYTMRVAALIGDRLGMDDLRAVECVSGGTRRLFYVERSGNLVGLEMPVEAEIGPLRDKLGL